VHDSGYYGVNTTLLVRKLVFYAYQVRDDRFATLRPRRRVRTVPDHDELNLIR